MCVSAEAADIANASISKYIENEDIGVQAECLRVVANYVTDNGM